MAFFFEIKGYLTEKTMQWFKLYPSLSSIKIWKKSNFRPLPRNLEFDWFLPTVLLKFHGHTNGQDLMQCHDYFVNMNIIWNSLWCHLVSRHYSWMVMVCVVSIHTLYCSLTDSERWQCRDNCDRYFPHRTGQRPFSVPSDPSIFLYTCFFQVSIMTRLSPRRSN